MSRAVLQVAKHGDLNPRPRFPPRAASDDLPARIARLERELLELRRRLHEQVIVELARLADGPFTTLELVARSDRDPALAAALGTRNPRQVGKRLQALVGHPVGPYVLARAKRETGGRVWLLQVAVD